MESVVGIASLVISFLSLVSMIWIGAFRLAAVEHGLKEVTKCLDRMDMRFDKLEDAIRKIDIRVSVLEHRKP